MNKGGKLPRHLGLIGGFYRFVCYRYQKVTHGEAAFSSGRE
jgi:hypothetical protein